MEAIAYTHENMTCITCGQPFEADVVYIFGHRQGRDLCQTCTRLEREQDKAHEEQKRQLEITSVRRMWRLSCGIPARFQAKDFSTFESKRAPDAYKMAVEYAEAFPLAYKAWLKGKPYPSMLLFSNDVWGNGKTHLAAAICHRILDRWQGEEITCPVVFISEPEIYSRIQETYSYSQEERQQKPSEQQIIGRLCAASLLVIDDLGKQERTDMAFVRRTLFEIINRRYNAMKPVVITSNKDGSGLKNYLGRDEAIFDRIWEMTEGHVIRLTGKSYRRER